MVSEIAVGAVATGEVARQLFFRQLLGKAGSGLQYVIDSVDEILGRQFLFGLCNPDKIGDFMQILAKDRVIAAAHYRYATKANARQIVQCLGMLDDVDGLILEPMLAHEFLGAQAT